MRKLIKAFELLGVGRDLARLSTASAWEGLWIAMTGAWRHQLRQLVAERAHSANDAVVHSTGVYFPKRSHEARIAIKKFRYAVEISEYAGVLVDEPLIRTLRKAQDLLGEMHDRQTLIDELNDSRELAGIDAGQIDVVVRVAEVEIADLHARVLTRRPEVLEACRRAQRAVRGSELPIGAFAVVGAVALATSLEARRRHRHAVRPVTRDNLTPEVSVRIPVSLPAGTKRVEPAGPDDPRVVAMPSGR
jgi:hypothetical protein